MEFIISNRERTARIGRIFENDDVVYIVGGAGYGKSLFFKKVAVAPNIIQGFSDRPLLIIRGDIKRIINTDGTFKSMSVFLKECFTNSSLVDENEVHPDFLTKCLKAGRCLVLLDALDEVGNDHRNELHSLIISYFQSNYPKNKVCIASRERGFIPLDNVTCFYITPITMIHVSEYVDNFIALGKFNADEKDRFLEQSSVLVKKGFVKGFLTLSLLLAIYNNEHELPTNKILLYEKCFEWITSTRERSKHLLRNSSNGEEYDWIALAKLMNDATFMELTQLGLPNNADIPIYKIEDLMLSLYEQRFGGSTECKMATEMFLQFCADRTEIFVPSPNSNTDYRFYHRSFFEYFFAKYIEARTIDVISTYEKMCLFDVDSEIPELLMSLYQRRNPNYLRELLSYVFDNIEESCATDEFLVYGFDKKTSQMFGILIMMLQGIEEKDFAERFFNLLMDIDAKHPNEISTLNYEMLLNAIKQNEQSVVEKFNANRKIYLLHMRNCIAELFDSNRVYCMDLLTQIKRKELSNLDNAIKPQCFYSYLITVLSDMYNIMDELFDLFSDPKRIIFINNLDKNSRKTLMSFATKVNSLTYKDRQKIFATILSLRPPLKEFSEEITELHQI